LTIKSCDIHRKLAIFTAKVVIFAVRFRSLLQALTIFGRAT